MLGKCFRAAFFICFFAGIETVAAQRDLSERFVHKVLPETVCPFYSSLGEVFDAPLNDFWRLYVFGGNYGRYKEKFMGGILFWDAPETSGGCDWSERKTCWYDDREVRDVLRRRLLQIPFDRDSRYLWSTDGSRLHVFQQRIITTNPELATKTWETLKWETPEFAKKWLHSTQDFGIGAVTASGRTVEYCSPNDYVGRAGDFGHTLEQTFVAAEPLSALRLKFYVTEESIYQLRLCERLSGRETARRVFRGKEEHADSWTTWRLDAELPPGEYLIELKNVSLEVLGETMTWQMNAKYRHPVGWYASEWNVYPDGESGINGRIGETPYERLNASMDYMLADHPDSTTVRGGLTIITHPDQTGVPVSMENRDSVSLPSTSYDLVRSGYQDALTNIRWRESYRAMMNIERFFGDPQKALEYRCRVREATDAFRRTFWNPETERYAGWIDKEGRMWDFGEVAINLMAICSNHETWKLGEVGDAEEMRDEHRRILDWIHGRREVTGDTSRGADIYAFGFAPRKNTLAYESLGLEKNHWWGGWYYNMRPEGDGRGNFGYQEENGGTNPVIGYYDIMATLALAAESGAEGSDERRRYIEEAWDRFWTAPNSMLREFAKDRFYRPTPHPVWEPNPDDLYQIYVMTLPESGMPVNAVLEGFMGIEADPDSIRVRPMLPNGVEFLGVKGVLFQGTRYQVKTRQGNMPEMTPMSIYDQ